jgi:hypothetical protein
MVDVSAKSDFEQLRVWRVSGPVELAPFSGNFIHFWVGAGGKEGG